MTVDQARNGRIRYVLARSRNVLEASRPVSPPHVRASSFSQSPPLLALVASGVHNRVHSAEPIDFTYFP